MQKNEIKNICILPEYQNRGIELQLLKDILEINSNRNIIFSLVKQHQLVKVLRCLDFTLQEENSSNYIMVKNIEHKHVLK